MAEFNITLDQLNKVENDIKSLNNDFNTDNNIFYILGIQQTEIRHSNMIAWLFDSKGSFTYAAELLKIFITKIKPEIDSYEKKKGICNDWEKLDFGNFYSRREHEYIDILIISDDKKRLILIENKTKSKQHNNQLKRYKDIVNDEYSDYKKIFLYLTPLNEEPRDPDYIQISYKPIYESLKSLKDKYSGYIQNTPIIIDYIKTLEKEFFMSDDLNKKALDIYAKNKDVFNYIYELVSNKANIRDYVQNKIYLLSQNDNSLVYDKNLCNDTYVRFSLKKLNNEYEDIESLKKETDTNKDAWKLGFPYFIEIACEKNLLKEGKLRIQLTFNFDNKNNSKYIETSKELYHRFKPADKELSGKINVLRDTKNFTEDYSTFILEDEDTIKDKINECVDKLVKDIISKIEKKL